MRACWTYPCLPAIPLVCGAQPATRVFLFLCLQVFLKLLLLLGSEAAVIWNRILAWREDDVVFVEAGKIQVSAVPAGFALRPCRRARLGVYSPAGILRWIRLARKGPHGPRKRNEVERAGGGRQGRDADRKAADRNQPQRCNGKKVVDALGE